MARELTVRQSEKPKKKFCFATIPLVTVALLCLIECIRIAFSVLPDICKTLDSAEGICNMAVSSLYLSGFAFILIGAVALSILLFAKVYNAWLGVPLISFAAAFLMCFGAQTAYAFSLTCGEEIIFDTFGEALFDGILDILVILSAVFAFFIAAVYTFIVTKTKKPVSAMLRIISVILFTLFCFPRAILSPVYFAELVYYLEFESLIYFPEYLTDFLLPVAVILFLIWLSFPYKKEKPTAANCD